MRYDDLGVAMRGGNAERMRRCMHIGNLRPLQN
jgi:hypothetical protein